MLIFRFLFKLCHALVPRFVYFWFYRRREFEGRGFWILKMSSFGKLSQVVDQSEKKKNSLRECALLLMIIFMKRGLVKRFLTVNVV